MVTPSPTTTPYPEVNAVLQDVLACVRGVLGSQFVGMYLYGSLALGDFQPTWSDIDYVVVTDGPLAPDRVAALAALHADLGGRWEPWGHELEGSYIPQAIMRRADPATPYPTIERGESLRVGAHPSRGAIQRHVLRTCGIALAGPPIASLVDPVTPADLRADVAAVAAEWLVPLQADRAAFRNKGYQGYTVLTLCRMLYTLAFGTVVSKPGAARWAQGALGPRWAPLIARALAEDSAETWAFIGFVLEQMGAE